ncbi:YibE/F family protein [Haloglycomyces albus]|uniref:YibE/F family protein n=1 Tax=Haloglycomyces albus TaxID=526067 RepID=UPI00046D49C6|nr:YibE/F family protein [Haloglycomyces albus]
MSHNHHTHTTGNDTVPRRALWILIPAALATLIGLVWLWPIDYSAADVEHNDEYKADVLAVNEMECPEGQGELAVPGPCGEVAIRLMSGPDQGKETIVDLPSGPGAPTVDVGDSVIVMHLPGAMDGTVYHIIDHERSSVLWAALIAFALAIIAFGRWKGLRSLLSLAITFAVLLLFIIPAILNGSSPLTVAVVGASAIMLVSIFVTHGWNRSATVAVLGTLSALLVTGVLAAAATSLANLTGIVDEDTSNLSLNFDLDMSGLLLAGILIGALGVIDDITVSQAATVDELAKANPKWTIGHLFRSGTRVGTDHITSVVNTLVLAYAGASLPLLVLIVGSDSPVGQVLTNELIAAEILRSVVGTLGLIAAVPITTYLAAVFIRKGRSSHHDPDDDPLTPPTRRRKRISEEPSWDEDLPYPPGHL